MPIGRVLPINSGMCRLSTDIGVMGMGMNTSHGKGKMEKRRENHQDRVFRNEGTLAVVGPAVFCSMVMPGVTT